MGTKPLYTPQPELHDGETLLWCDGESALIAHHYKYERKGCIYQRIYIHKEIWRKDHRTTKEERGDWENELGSLDLTIEQSKLLRDWLNTTIERAE